MYKASPRYEIPLTKEQTNQQGQNPERNVPKLIASPAEPEASPRLQTPHNHPHPPIHTHTHRLLGAYSAKDLGKNLKVQVGEGTGRRQEKLPMS